MKASREITSEADKTQLIELLTRCVRSASHVSVEITSESREITPVMSYSRIFEPIGHQTITLTTFKRPT